MPGEQRVLEGQDLIGALLHEPMRSRRFIPRTAKTNVFWMLCSSPCHNSETGAKPWLTTREPRRLSVRWCGKS